MKLRVIGEAGYTELFVDEESSEIVIRMVDEDDADPENEAFEWAVPVKEAVQIGRALIEIAESL